MKTNIMLVKGNSSLFGNTDSELNRSNIEIAVADNTENAIEKFQKGGTDMVIVDHTIDATEKRKLYKVFSLLNEAVAVVETEEAENIDNTITKALQQNLQRSYSFIDDAFLKARFNIKVEEWQ